MKELMELVRLMGPRRWALPVLIGLGAVASLAESFGFGLLIPFAHEVLGQDHLGQTDNAFIRAVNGFAALLGEENRQEFLALAIVTFVLTKSLIMFVYGGLASWLREETAHTIRSTLTARLLALDYGRYTARNPADYHNVIAGETWAASDTLASLFTLISHVVTAGVFLTLLLILSWPLVAIAVVIFLCASFMVQWVSNRAEELGQEGVEANTAFAERSISLLSGMKTVRAFAQEGHEQAAIDDRSDTIRRKFLQMHLLSGAVGPLLEAIYVPALIGMVFFSSLVGTPVPTLIAFLVIMYRLIPHIRAIEEDRVNIASGTWPVNEVTKILRLDTQPARGGRLFDGLNDAIDFVGVTFAYGEGAREGNAVQDVSFRVPRGATVALVGMSGAGKSTLVSLLLGFYAPQAGEIRLDGQPLGSYDLASWRRRVGFAGQDIQLFPGTIADNIAYGRPGATQAHIEDAARRADALGFIQRMDKGFATEITRDGLDLSGGQRQRIALARAFLIDPDVLVLDEATNALDNVTEATLQAVLATYAGQKTVLIIAHRLNTIRHADWIVALDGGRVAEQGTPQDLLGRDMAFARLYKLEAETDRLAAEQTR